jgi:hypothetical protein
MRSLTSSGQWLAFVLLVPVLFTSSFASARSLDPQECPADTKRLEYSDIVFCWPSAKDAAEFKFESSGMLLGSQYWVGRHSASDAEIKARGRDTKNGLPTLAMLRLVPRDHPILQTDPRVYQAAQIKKALDRRGNEAEVAVTVLVSNSVGERELRFRETGRNLLTASIPVTDSAATWKLEAWASMNGDRTIDYVMICNVLKGIRSCSGDFPLANILATISVNFAEDAHQALHIIESMRGQLRASVIYPKLNAP